MDVLPNYVQPITRFHDAASGWDMMLAKVSGEDWILYKHPDGQWVTLRKPTDDDLARLNSAVIEMHHN